MEHGTFNTVIAGYEVEVETFEEDGEERSQGWVSKGDYSGSLNMLEQCGSLEDDTWCKTHYVSENVSKAIFKWAYAKGY